MNATMLDNTKRMLEELEDDQLEAVHTVVRTFIMDSPFRPKTEKELLEKIDASLAGISTDECQDADEMCDELIAEFNL